MPGWFVVTVGDHLGQQRRLAEITTAEVRVVPGRGLAFGVDDYEAAHALHEEMGCICYENKKMGIYFISDPDGYWLEVLPRNHASQH